jgi:hypothetical protein
LAALLFFPVAASTHPGGLDASGGHRSRSGYHFHSRQQDEAAAKKAFSRQSTLSPAVRDRRISDYFRAANENVGALSCNLRLHPREVPEEIKQAVKRRDGNRCVICSSRRKLEVDHRRALMNGGDNSISNLATLCDDCHTIKTRMDTSLRRKREKSCRG